MHQTRTIRDLRWLAEQISAGTVRRAVSERLEALAAWSRMVAAAEAYGLGDDGALARANDALGRAMERLRATGVGQGEGEFTFSPWCGPDKREENQP